jgi:hypothetical protein
VRTSAARGSATPTTTTSQAATAAPLGARRRPVREGHETSCQEDEQAGEADHPGEGRVRGGEGEVLVDARGDGHEPGGSPEHRRDPERVQRRDEHQARCREEDGREDRQADGHERGERTGAACPGGTLQVRLGAHAHARDDHQVPERQRLDGQHEHDAEGPEQPRQADAREPRGETARSVGRGPADGAHEAGDRERREDRHAQPAPGARIGALGEERQGQPTAHRQQGDRGRRPEAVRDGIGPGRSDGADDAPHALHDRLDGQPRHGQAHEGHERHADDDRTGEAQGRPRPTKGYRAGPGAHPPKIAR